MSNLTSIKDVDYVTSILASNPALHVEKKDGGISRIVFGALNDPDMVFESSWGSITVLAPKLEDKTTYVAKTTVLEGMTPVEHKFDTEDTRRVAVDSIRRRLGDFVQIELSEITKKVRAA